MKDSSPLRRVSRPAARRVAAAVTSTWMPYSRLFLVGEGAAWVIDEELRAIARLAGDLGVRLADRRLMGAARRQAIFFGSHFTLLGPHWPERDHRIGTTYFHGRPGTPGAPEFDDAYAELRKRHAGISRVQVSHREMEAIVLESGIDPAKVFRIPIGIDLARFERRTPGSSQAVRAQLGLPENAFVVGSFQKDGVGWEDGLEPKLIKGPDVLVATLARLRARVPELQVLLSSPARGYVKAGLERHGVPYVHRVFDRYDDVGRLYQALDAYVVPSRQEGGPKGVLEAMASGVPMVSTRVGQAMDLVRDGENGRLVDVDDVDGLVERLAELASGDSEPLVAAGLETAAANSYEAQLPLWRSFFDGFVAT